jgi:hypothetical protein
MVSTSVILAIDLGMFKSVLCFYDVSSKKTCFRTLVCDPGEFRKIFKELKDTTVVIEACSPAGWVHRHGPQAGPDRLRPGQTRRGIRQTHRGGGVGTAPRANGKGTAQTGEGTGLHADETGSRDRLTHRRLLMESNSSPIPIKDRLQHSKTIRFDEANACTYARKTSESEPNFKPAKGQAPGAIFWDASSRLCAGNLGARQIIATGYHEVVRSKPVFCRWCRGSQDPKPDGAIGTGSDFGPFVW